MKKALLLISIIFALTGCEKEEPENCDCGRVQEKEVLSFAQECVFRFIWKSQCEGIDTEFVCVSETDYNDYFVGDDYCK